jgi:hypothetical protein
LSTSTFFSALSLAESNWKSLKVSFEQGFFFLLSFWQVELSEQQEDATG